MLAIIAWTLITSGIFFFAMSKLSLLRVSLVDEIIGLDIAEMGTQAKIHAQEKIIARRASISLGAGLSPAKTQS